MGIASLDTVTPTSSTLASTGAADIRALRVAIRETFVNFGIGTDVVTATAAQINGAPNKAGAETISGAWVFSAGIQAAAGSQSAPSYAFIGDPDTGIYSEGSNVVNVATNGAKRLSISSPQTISYQPIWAPDGSEAAPAYTFTADSTTGFYRSNATEISFTAVGNRAVSFNDSGVELRRIGGNWTGIEFWNSAGDRKALFDLDSEAGNVALYPVTGSAEGTYGPYVFAYDQSSASFYVGYPIRVSGGSPTAPTYTFGIDPDTGIYQNGGASIGFTVNGTERGYFRPDGGLQLINGVELGVAATANLASATSVTVPTVTPSTDSSTKAASTAFVRNQWHTASLHKDPHTLAGTASEVGATWTVNPNAPAVGTDVTATSDGRLTANANGVYRVDLSCSVYLAASSSSFIGLMKNGSALTGSALETVSNPAVNAILTPFSSSVLVSLNSGQYVSLYAHASAGSGILYNAQFLMQRIA